MQHKPISSQQYIELSLVADGNNQTSHFTRVLHILHTSSAINRYTCRWWKCLLCAKVIFFRPEHPLQTKHLIVSRYARWNYPRKMTSSETKFPLFTWNWKQHAQSNFRNSAREPFKNPPTSSLTSKYQAATWFACSQQWEDNIINFTHSQSIGD